MSRKEREGGTRKEKSKSGVWVGETYGKEGVRVGMRDGGANGAILWDFRNMEASSHAQDFRVTGSSPIICSRLSSLASSQARKPLRLPCLRKVLEDSSFVLCSCERGVLEPWKTCSRNHSLGLLGSTPQPGSQPEAAGFLLR